MILKEVDWMAGATFKCPSCGAYLTFDPESQLWKCPFCSSSSNNCVNFIYKQYCVIYLFKFIYNLF